MLLRQSTPLAVLCALSFAGPITSHAAGPYMVSGQTPPPLAREFRGAWVATVFNLNWPSRPGLPVERQKAELVSLMDRAAELKLNAIIFQVRPGCDALYKSKLEPWSQWISGKMGVGPNPEYDPLELAVRLAHERGIELHAWFNPFRAMPNRSHSASATHISRTRPDFVRRYGQHLWLDPGDSQVRDYAIKVIIDVVRRYDIDGVHLDDYFYPYPAKTSNGGIVPFPDDVTWQKYRALGGKLGRSDWRRSNVDEVVERLQSEIRKTKSWVKFGISPFGIWRPGYPAAAHSDIDAYEHLGADSRRWLAQGWVDYLSPQLYWSIDSRQPFPALLDWWLKENPKQRHVWPGVASDRIGKSRPASEITRQIAMVRKKSPAGTAGHIQWDMRALLQDRRGISGLLKGDMFADRALVPACSWMSSGQPAAPKLAISEDDSGTRLKWIEGSDKNPAWLWAVQTRRDGKWDTRVHPAGTDTAFWRKGSPIPDVVAVTAVSRCGHAGPSAVVEKNKIVPAISAIATPTAVKP